MSREIFKLHGIVSASGIEGVKSALTALDKQLTAADRAFAKFGRQATRIGTTFTKYITGPLAAVGAAAMAAGYKTIEYSDRLVKLNEITGLSTDSLQEFSHVAKISGTNFETVTKSIEMFAHQLPEIAKKSGPAYEAVKQLGVSIFDSAGKVRDINDLLPDLLKRLQLIENPMERLAAAQEIFGRSAGDLGPILKMTGAQLDAMRKEARDLGIVMDEKTVRAADALSDEIDKLKEQASAMVMEIGAEFLPVFRDELLPLIKTKIIPAVKEFADKIRGLIQWFAALDGSTKAVIGFTAALGPMLIALGNTIAITRELIKTIGLLRAAFLMNPFGAAILGATVLIGVLAALDKRYKKAAMEKAEKARSDAINKELQDLKNLEEEQRRIIETGKGSHFQLYSEDEVRQAENNLETLTQMARDYNQEIGLSSPETPETPAPVKPASIKYNFETGDREKTLNDEEDLRNELKAVDSRWLAYNKERNEKAMALEEEIGRFMTDTRNKAAEEQKAINARIAAEDAQYAETTVRIFVQLAQNIGAAIASGIGEGAEGMKNAFNGILTVFVDFIERMMIGAIVENAIKNFAGFPGGIPGLLKAAGEAAVLTAMFETAKKGIESFGDGAFVQGGRGGVVAQIGERRDDEIVMPMRTGIQALVDGIVARLGSIAPILPQPAVAGGGGPAVARQINLNVGTLIADERGMKMLERELSKYRISELQRMGAE